MLDYLSENHGIDEERACLGKSRLKGISVDYMLAKVKNKTDIRKRAADLLNSWDSGTASSTYLLSEDKSAYASCIFAGEQSYRRILEKHPKIIRQIIYLSTHANLYPEVEGREKLIEKYLDFLKIQLSLGSQEIQELEDFAARNINQMQAWNIVDVIDCKVLPENSKIDQLNLEFTKSFG